MNIQDIFAEIDAEISKLQQVKALLSGTSITEKRKPSRPTNASLSRIAKTKRTLSAAARAKIATAQRARWAKVRKPGNQSAPSTVAASPNTKVIKTDSHAKSTKKRAISSEGRANIVAAQKARWAKVRKAAKKASPTKGSKKSETAKKSIAAA
jgi:hypothetical protein